MCRLHAHCAGPGRPGVEGPRAGVEGERGVPPVRAPSLLPVTVPSAALSPDIAGRGAGVRRAQAPAALAALDAARTLLPPQPAAAPSARRTGVDNTKSGNTVTA